MKPGLSHRIRRHKLVEKDEQFTYTGWWEGGGIIHVLRCSCGQSWTRHQNSLTGKIRWL